jgi:hypothetical protein
MAAVTSGEATESAVVADATDAAELTTLLLLSRCDVNPEAQDSSTVPPRGSSASAYSGDGVGAGGELGGVKRSVSKVTADADSWSKRVDDSGGGSVCVHAADKCVACGVTLGAGTDAAAGDALAVSTSWSRLSMVAESRSVVCSKRNVA